MKIRIRGQSLRFRLGRSEVQRLALGEGVEESIDLSPDVRHTYTLRPAEDAGLSVIAGAGGVVVNVPKRQIAGWAGSDEIAIRESVAVGSGRSLRLLIEKDFACIDNQNGESQDDAFPNPSATC